MHLDKHLAEEDKHQAEERMKLEELEQVEDVQGLDDPSAYANSMHISRTIHPV